MKNKIILHLLYNWKKYLLATISIGIVVGVSLTLVFYNKAQVKDQDQNKEIEKELFLFPEMDSIILEKEIPIVDNEQALNDDFVAKIVKYVLKYFGTIKGELKFKYQILNSKNLVFNILWSFEDKQQEKTYQFSLD